MKHVLNAGCLGKEEMHINMDWENSRKRPHRRPMHRLKDVNTKRS
jgi:hypothetical protein